MDLSELGDSLQEPAEPFRFNFEIAWEVANKGRCSCTYTCRYVHSSVLSTSTANLCCACKSGRPYLQHDR